MGGRLIATVAILLSAVAALCFVPVASATDTHIDCSAESGGDGSATAPLNSLGSFAVGPGDRLLLRSETTCEGRLRVTGGGSVAQPAQVGAYGSGSLPKIVGTLRDAVLIEDASNLEVRDLDISNPGDGEPLGESTEIRNGLRATVSSGTLSNLSINDLMIHDVNGDLTKNPEGSAAIQISATGPPPARFENLTIARNRIDSVSRSGISITGTNQMTRPTADQSWPDASTGVVVKGNRIDMIAGDGIVPRGTDGAVVEGNVVSRGNQAGRPILDPKGAMCNAGIWTFHSNNTLIQGNEVFGMKHNGCDGTGFDVDYRQDGTIIQGNYSHQNEGGFVLLCSDKDTHRADVRFNLSVDDGAMINHGPCGITSGVIGDLSGIRMFNNTVVGATPSVSMQLGLVAEMFAPGDFRFENNLIYAHDSFGAAPCGNNCSHNAFFNLPPSGTDALTSDPKLTGPLAAGEGIGVAKNFKLASGSPLIQAGKPIESPGTADFFGNQLSGKPSIGFDQTLKLLPRPGPAPNHKCAKAKSALKKTKRRVRAQAGKLKKLKRKKAARAKVKRARKQLSKTRAKVKRQTKAMKKACS